MIRTLEVDAGGARYAIAVGAGVLERAHELIPAAPTRELIAVVTDANVAGLHGPRLEAGLRPTGWRLETFTLEPGERSKDAGTLEALWRWLAEAGMHRGDLLIALGGGVVGDVGGFAAATYHRGIAFAQAPTTLLGQVDAAIGGKTAIDLPEGKNLVGAFHQPIAVLCDTTALLTLPAPQFATGMAEVVKHGLIDPGDLAAWLVAERARIEARDLDALTELVARAAAVKVRVVAEDPTERGARAHLNYGHTLGHALEALDGYAGRTHGQAVAIGMMFAAHLAARVGFADRVREHRESIEAAGLPTVGAGYDFDQVAKAWQRDKKYDGGARFVLLEDLGRPVVRGGIDEADLRAAYEAVR